MLGRELTLFSILIESDDSRFITVQYAKNLEDASELARREFNQEYVKRMNQKPPDVLTVSLWSTVSEKELIQKRLDYVQWKKNKHDEIGKNFEKLIKDEYKVSFKELEDAAKISVDKKIKKKSKGEIKNELMKEIIKNKNINLFQSNEKMFSVAERKYIKEHLK
jgi:hypothetical protein